MPSSSIWFASTFFLPRQLPQALQVIEARNLKNHNGCTVVIPCLELVLLALGDRHVHTMPHLRSQLARGHVEVPPSQHHQLHGPFVIIVPPLLASRAAAPICHAPVVLLLLDQYVSSLSQNG